MRSCTRRVGVQVGRTLLAERKAVAETVPHRARVQQRQHAVLDDLRVRGQRTERPTVESTKHGVGDVADARLQGQQRRGADAPPSPRWQGTPRGARRFAARRRRPVLNAELRSASSSRRRPQSSPVGNADRERQCGRTLGDLDGLAKWRLVRCRNRCRAFPRAQWAATRSPRG